jgi:hypothetical protein
VPIVSTDLVFRFSAPAASAGDATAGAPDTSLGKYVANNAITTATLHNLFDKVTGAESAAGESEYRCGFVLNNHATLTAVAATIFDASETAGGATITVASDNIAASAKGSSSVQAAVVADENTAPTGVSAFGSSATLGDIAPGQVKAFWVKRTVAPGTTAIAGDGVILEVDCDTLP